jgi:hypothetical protein
MTQQVINFELAVRLGMIRDVRGITDRARMLLLALAAQGGSGAFTISQLAKLCGVSRTTVRKAIWEAFHGKVLDWVHNGDEPGDFAVKFDALFRMTSGDRTHALEWLDGPSQSLTETSGVLPD